MNSEAGALPGGASATAAAGADGSPVPRLRLVRPAPEPAGSAGAEHTAESPASSGPGTRQPGTDEPGTAERSTLLVLAAGLAAMALPTLWQLATTAWAGDEQGHGPVILVLSLWLLWRRRAAILALPARPAPLAGSLALLLALAGSVVGRSQQIVQFEVGALIVAGAALVLLLRGWPGLRLAAVPLLLLGFIVPLPGVLVQTLTVPLKTAVSYVAEAVMHLLGYPVARSGVILAVGQYQLLVADACAGLTSMFTLECLGLLYINLRGHASPWRNGWLAVLIVPIAFAANVVRVVVLSLVTFHFGDAAGQGFVHGFAGIVLFAVATVLMLAVDALLGRLPRLRPGQPAERNPT